MFLLLPLLPLLSAFPFLPPLVSAVGRSAWIMNLAATLAVEELDSVVSPNRQAGHMHRILGERMRRGVTGWAAGWLLFVQISCRFFFAVIRLFFAFAFAALSFDSLIAISFPSSLGILFALSVNICNSIQSGVISVPVLSEPCRVLYLLHLLSPLICLSLLFRFRQGSQPCIRLTSDED